MPAKQHKQNYTESYAEYERYMDSVLGIKRKAKKSYFHFLSYDEIIKDFKLTRRPRWQKKVAYPIIVTFACLWMLAPVIFLGSLVYYNQSHKDEWRQNAEMRQVAKDECDKRGADYDIYYDNGKDEPGVCRIPITEAEWESLKEIRAYRRALEEGDIDPPSLDENCYTSTICQ